MKIAAVVVTYYPNTKETEHNVRQYIDHVDNLIVWENTPTVDLKSYRLNFTAPSQAKRVIESEKLSTIQEGADNDKTTELEGIENKIIRMGTGKNEGIAYALNRAAEWAIDNGFTHLLTMDQDSEFVNFNHYKEQVDSLSDSCDIAIYSPNVNHKVAEQSAFIDIPYALTSGSIFRLDIFKFTGLFREDYFIDGVDLEFCYRAANHGYKTILMPECHIKHKLGEKVRNKIGIRGTLYSEFRTYMIVRNHIILWREYPKQFNRKHQFVDTYIIGRFFKILLLDKQKAKKMRALFKGIYDGMRYKLPEIKR